ncbi:hypothetical protein M885DRAFT_623242 [Pelagophyceae sp. CCMP2097]|nr:hypothetical protein M885DRAFT_623242 [Pelagophyceae sp. CCMP2097]
MRLFDLPAGPAGVLAQFVARDAGVGLVCRAARDLVRAVVRCCVAELRAAKSWKRRRRALDDAARLGGAAAGDAVRAALASDASQAVRARAAFWLARLGAADGARGLEPAGVVALLAARYFGDDARMMDVRDAVRCGMVAMCQTGVPQAVVHPHFPAIHEWVEAATASKPPDALQRALAKSHLLAAAAFKRLPLKKGAEVTAGRAGAGGRGAGARGGGDAEAALEARRALLASRGVMQLRRPPRPPPRAGPAPPAPPLRFLREFSPGARAGFEPALQRRDDGEHDEATQDRLLTLWFENVSGGPVHVREVSGDARLEWRAVHAGVEIAFKCLLKLEFTKARASARDAQPDSHVMPAGAIWTARCHTTLALEARKRHATSDPIVWRFAMRKADARGAALTAALARAPPDVSARLGVDDSP